MGKEFRQLNVPAQVHTADDKIFFPGPAHLTESDAKNIEAELERQKSIGVADTKVREAPEGEVETAEGDIPNTFPHAADLRKNNVTTMAQLNDMSKEDLTELKGIGEAKANDIIAERG